MRQIPTEDDWRSEPWCLDMPHAYKHFFGKSVDEAVMLLMDNSVYYQEDLMFMPRRCLEYYITAYIDYLMSDASEGDSDGAFCFFGLVECRHEEIIGFEAETTTRTKTLLERLARQQSWYDADPTIYGDFAVKAQRMLELMT